MAASRIRLNAQQAEDFAAVCELGPDKLQAILSALDALDRPFLKGGDLRQSFASIVGDESAQPLLRQLISFSIGLRREAFSSEIVDAISDALKERSWDSDKLAQWDAIKNVFLASLSHKHIKHAAKAFDLAFDYANLFNYARIITDVRPVFDDDHSEIIGGIVRHVLRLSYSSVDGPKDLSIVLDKKDIENVKIWCESALKKENALASFLEKPKPVEKILPGEERDELR